jgi:hypothetical protein
MMEMVSRDGNRGSVSGNPFRAKFIMGKAIIRSPSAFAVLAMAVTAIISMKIPDNIKKNRPVVVIP